MSTPEELSCDFGLKDPSVVLAADENFAMPLATTVRSAIDNLATDRKLQVVVLGSGLHDETKRRLERSWPSSRCSVSWIDVDTSSLRDVPLSGHVSEVAYFRILLSRLLPKQIERAVYLDSDLIVRGDLSDLWAHDFDGTICLAVQDCGAPFIDSALALPNLKQCVGQLAATKPVANYQELGLDGRAPYFNSGVLLIDIAAWREQNLAEQMLECLDRNSSHVRWWDQYVLNVVLAGKWKMIDPCWNQGSHMYSYRDWQESPYDAETFDRIRDEPYIIHYTTDRKPWKLSCVHPRRAEFYEYLDRTEWAGWRPARFRSMSTVLEVIKAQLRRLRFARRRWQYVVKRRISPAERPPLKRAA